MVIEHKHEPYRPIYPVICFQLQGVIWCGLKLQMDKKFCNEFQASSIDSKILYIWIIQLFCLVLTALVHRVLKKILQKINPIYQHYENSSSKIMLLCFVVDFGLIELILHRCITNIMKHSISAMDSCTPNIPWLNNTSERSLSNIFGRIGNFVLKILVLFCILIIYYLPILFLLVLYISAFVLIEYAFILEGSLVQFIIGLFVFVFYVGLIFVIYTVNENFLSYSTLKFLVKSLLGLVKTLFLFLIVFVPYCAIISAALYILVFVLQFAIVKTFHVLIGFLFFSFSSVGLFFLCKKSNNT